MSFDSTNISFSKKLNLLNQALDSSSLLISKSVFGEENSEAYFLFAVEIEFYICQLTSQNKVALQNNHQGNVNNINSSSVENKSIFTSELVPEIIDLPHQGEIYPLYNETKEVLLKNSVSMPTKHMNLDKYVESLPPLVPVLPLQELQCDGTTVMGIYSKIAKIGEHFDIFVENIEEEDGLNQFEIQTRPTDDAVKLAQFISALQCFSIDSIKNGDVGDFVLVLGSKPFAKLPGNAMHFHVSLYECNDFNMFGSVTDKQTEYQDSLYYAIAGLLQTMPYCMTILAPTENCYNRFTVREKNTVHKCNPTNYSWGINNRTCAIRVPQSITSSEANTRLEYRVCSTVANSFDVLLVIISGITFGICKKIPKVQPIFGDAFDPIYSHLVRMPVNLSDAHSQSKKITEILSMSGITSL